MTRTAGLIAILAVATPTATRADWAFNLISIEGCHSVQTLPGFLASQIPPMDLDDYLVANPEQMAIYLCDADLPDTATGFDSVGLEYIGGYQAVPPWVIAYADVQVQGTNGDRYSWVEEVGWGYGYQTPGEITVPGQGPPIYVAWTNGLSWASNMQQAWDQRLSIFFLVFVPVWNLGDPGAPVTGSEPWNAVPFDEVFRLIVQYQL